MRIVDVAIKQLYRFNCPACGSRLEAEVGELRDIGGKVSEFYCPICKRTRHISWNLLKKRTVYESRVEEDRAL